MQIQFTILRTGGDYLFTLVIGKNSIEKMSFIATHIKTLYSKNTIFILDTTGELTNMLNNEGLLVTNKIIEAEIIVSDGVNKTVKEKDLFEKEHVFCISNGEDLEKNFVEKAQRIVLFPVSNPEKMSELLDIPVGYLQDLKPFEPITVI